MSLPAEVAAEIDRQSKRVNALILAFIVATGAAFIRPVMRQHDKAVLVEGSLTIADFAA